jgi:formylglycine-generating enzyme required for sulfatase activity
MKKNNKPSVSQNGDPLSSQERGPGVSSIEITHDILAKKIYARIDADEKMRLKITQMLRDRYTYHQETGELLSRRDLAYIDPYLEQVELSKEQEAFIKQSRIAVKKQINRNRLIVAGVMTALLGLLTFATIQWYNAINATKNIVKFVIDDANQDIYKLRYDDALEKFQNAYELDNNSEEVLKGMMELALYYGVSDREKALELANIAGSLSKNKGVKEALSKVKISNVDFLTQLDTALAYIHPNWFDTLTWRYYPSMVKIEGGRFRMGETDSKYLVELTDYQLANTETTIWQYNLYCKNTGRDSMERIKPSVSWGLDGDNPMIFVSWYDAAFYANWLSAKNGLDSVYTIVQHYDSTREYWRVDSVIIDYEAKGYRLPSEAQWEYAAAGGIYGYDQDSLNRKYEYAGTSDQDSLEYYAWYSRNSGSRTRSVGKKLPNPLGLFDMSGNVREWCQDWSWNYSDTIQHNPIGPSYGSLRVLRGGSWDYDARDCRVSYRYRDFPSYRNGVIGFRLSRTP